MISALLSSKGTMSPADFIKSGILLIILGFAFIGAGFFLPFDGRGLVLASFLLGIPWVFIWIKRLRYGGASGALVLAYLALYAALFFIVFLVSIFFFSSGDIMEVAGQYARQEITMDEYQAALQESMDPVIMLRNMLIAGLLASLVTLFIGNMATPKTAISE